MNVNRGLLHTEAQYSPIPTAKPKERAEAKLERLKAAPLHSPVWKEAVEYFRAVARKKPADLSGARIYTDYAIGKARYLARTFGRAYRGKRLPEGREWAYIRAALETVYEELR